MALELKTVVPWGRSLEEYIDIFSLSDDDLNKKIIGCGDGPSSFNCAMHRQGRSVVSIDPVYEFSRDEIEERIHVAKDEIRPQLETSRDNYVWERFRSPDELIEYRMQTMSIFLNDYDEGKIQGRYLAYCLPTLPFADDIFDLALCSHLLFNFQKLGYGFHLNSILEMLRISREARIFPVVDINGDTVPYRGMLIDELRLRGFSVELQPVRYRSLKKADSMMVVQWGRR
jgi:hypothetical protein